ncbi:E3 ubiquitin-protein ligase TRIM71 [Mizuhopecten yessoensis]|uniref:E3 ubiquitin-protein ligase TRIM71 n=1 Tax=Mizuhopecten yessoensis TaxID=6573 RepID=A0A210PXD4_MIZYE|nr:E3 ubiquitin-protein ligase TRIM71 [Mizuhopecten yessoensis]
MASEEVCAPSRQPGQSACAHHPGRTLTLFCDLCKDLACLTCLSTVHKGHEMRALSDLTTSTRAKIQQYIDTTEDRQCLQLIQCLTWAEDELMQTSHRYDRLTEKIVQQGKALKLKIDVITCMSKGLYKQLEEENKRKLQIYITDLHTRLDAVNDNLRNCKHILAEGTDIQTYDTGYELITKPIQPLPIQPSRHCFTFVPNEAPSSCLEKAFGELTTSAEHKPLIHTEKMMEFKSEDFISSICPNRDNGAWICNHGNTVTLLDKRGKTETVLQYKGPIRDVQISPNTQNLWLCSDDNFEIMECDTSLKQTTTRFTPDSKVYCLCVTVDEHILVGSSKKIMKYTPCGTILLTSGKATTKTSFFKRSAPLVRSAYRMSECGITRHVAVMDMDKEEDGGQYQKQVLVIDKDFQELFRYKGDLPHTRGGCKMDNPFSPCDVQFDTFGHLVISDRANGCIRLLSGDGQFIRLLHVDAIDAGVIGIDHKNVLWAVFGQVNVKILKYYE